MNKRWEIGVACLVRTYKPFHGRAALSLNPRGIMVAVDRRLVALVQIQAAVLAVYGEQDRFINPGIPDIEAAMAKNGKAFEKMIYPGAGHGFHNDTGGARYNADAAKDAWAKTMAFFNKHLMA